MMYLPVDFGYYKESTQYICAVNLNITCIACIHTVFDYHTSDTFHTQVIIVCTYTTDTFKIVLQRCNNMKRSRYQLNQSLNLEKIKMGLSMLLRNLKESINFNLIQQNLTSNQSTIFFYLHIQILLLHGKVTLS